MTRLAAGEICIRVVYCADIDCSGEIDGSTDFERPICIECGALYASNGCDTVSTGEYDADEDS